MDSTTTVRWNPGDVSEDHNKREESLCQNESHIDLYNKHGESFHEAIIEKNLRDAYEEIFAEPINFYNSFQKKKSRRLTVDSYMKSIEDDTRGKRQTKLVNGKRVAKENARQGKQLSYEITACVGNTFRQKDDDGHVIYDDTNHHVRPEEFPRELQLEILREYAKGFADRNENFKVVNMHIHGDEGFYNKRGEWEYANIGIHIEIIPVASGFKQGLPFQNSMNKALLQMGFDTPDCYSLWAKKEQSVLEDITYEHYEAYCLAHPDFYASHGDLNLYHPVADKTREGGLTKEQLAHDMELDEAISEVQAINKSLQQDVESNRQKSEELNQREAELSIKESGVAKREAEAIALAKKSKDTFDKLVIDQQLIEKEFEEIDTYKTAVDGLTQRSQKQLARIEKLNLPAGFMDYAKSHCPDKYEIIQMTMDDYKKHLKEQATVESIEAPEQVTLISEETVSEQVNREVRHLEAVNKEYEEMQEEETLLKKGKVIPKATQEESNKPRVVPAIDTLPSSADDYEKN